MITSLDDAYEVIDRLRQQRDAARTEAADLRRQLAETQAEIASFVAMRAAANAAIAEAAELRRQLAEERMRANAAEFVAAQLRDDAADQRRQVAHANRWRDTAISEANEARAEAADLRRQLEEAQAEIAALRIENAAIAAIAAICPTCGGSGEVDSGGVSPWGAGIEVTCPTCNGSGKAYNDDATPLMWETATDTDTPPHRPGKGTLR